jgi:hypothetical protein
MSKQTLKQKTLSPDMVNRPPHYTSGPKCSCGKTIECIDVVNDKGFLIGNVIKYLWRCDAKGSPIQDLKKAAWYLQKEIERRESL